MHNTISDLGNSSCGVFNERYVCSPLHPLMNASFLYLGISMIIGSWLVSHLLNRKTVSVGFGLFAIGGFGVILVALFPENTVPILHGIGAAFPFLIGNAGVVILGYSLQIPKGLKIYTLITGIMALGALGFYASSHYLGLGEGGIERVVAYPQTIWMTVIGLYFWRTNIPTKAPKHQ